MRRFGKIGKIGLLATILWVVGLTFLGGVPSVWAEEDQEALRWNDEDILADTYSDMDIRDVLAQILKRNGQRVVFLPGVGGVVTFDFSHNRMPLRAAFNKLLTENRLTYTYDAKEQTVNIRQDSPTAIVDEIFTPKYSDLESVLGALDRFNLLGGDITITADHITNSLFLHGVNAQVSNLKRIAMQIDISLKNQGDKIKSSVELEQVQKQRALEQLRLEQTLTIEGQRALMEREKMDAERAIDVKVIPLRYASVDKSTTFFQGESVTLPGIVDSLKAFVGPMTVMDVNKEDSGDKKAELSMSGNRTTTSNRPVVSIDVRTNSIIVQGSPQQIKRIEDVIKKLDRPVPLVEIEVMIVNGTVDATRQLGIQWGVNEIVGPNRTKLSSANQVVSDLTMTTAPTNLNTEMTAVYESGVTSSDNVPAIGVVNTATPTGDPADVGVYQLASGGLGLGAGFLYKGTRQLLDATLNAMALDGKAHAIASPRVVTLDNLPAKITNSTNFNFVVTTGDGTTSGIQTVSSGISLDITPSVIVMDEDGSSRLVRLAINATNSTPGSQTGSSVTTNSQQVQTNVIIPNGGTFVMGGLFSTVRSETNSGVPLLKDIPVLGKLFGSTGSENHKQETVFFITPKIYSFKDIASSQGVRAKDYMEDQRFFLNQEQQSLEEVSQLLAMPHAKMSEDE